MPDKSAHDGSFFYGCVLVVVLIILVGGFFAIVDTILGMAAFVLSGPGLFLAICCALYCIFRRKPKVNDE